MQNYRLRLLREKFTLQQTIKPIAVAARDKAKQEEEAARRHLKLRVDLERQAQETNDERTKEGCEKLLQITAPLDTLTENLELARRKLSSTIRLVKQIQETEDRYQTELVLTNLVEDQYGPALEVIRKKFGDIEVVYKLNEKKRELDIFFGGQDYPLGPGHAHWVYRRDKFVVQRDPVVTQVA